MPDFCPTFFYRRRPAPVLKVGHSFDAKKCPTFARARLGQCPTGAGNRPDQNLSSQPIKYLLKYVGGHFIDRVIFTEEEWKEVKNELNFSKEARLPYLVDGEKSFFGASDILDHLSAKYQLIPQTEHGLKKVTAMKELLKKSFESFYDVIFCDSDSFENSASQYVETQLPLKGEEN